MASSSGCGSGSVGRSKTPRADGTVAGEPRALALKIDFRSQSDIRVAFRVSQKSRIVNAKMVYWKTGRYAPSSYPSARTRGTILKS